MTRRRAQDAVTVIAAITVAFLAVVVLLRGGLWLAQEIRADVFAAQAVTR